MCWFWVVSAFCMFHIIFFIWLLIIACSWTKMPTSSPALSLTKLSLTKLSLFSFLHFWCCVFSITNIINFCLQAFEKALLGPQTMPSHSHDSGKIQAYMMMRRSEQMAWQHMPHTLSMHNIQVLLILSSHLVWPWTWRIANNWQWADRFGVWVLNIIQCISTHSLMRLTLSCSIPPYKPHLQWLSFQWTLAQNRQANRVFSAWSVWCWPYSDGLEDR